METQAKKSKPENPMKKIFLEKVTLNICAGNDKLAMQKAEKLLIKLTNKTPVRCTAKKRIAQWQLRPGLPIGYKVTLRGGDAKKILKWVLVSKRSKLSQKSFDSYGNFSVGFHEYLDLEGMKYDAEIGIMGFEMVVTFARKGYRILRRRVYKNKVPLRHRVTKEEVTEYLKENIGVEVE